MLILLSATRNVLAASIIVDEAKFCNEPGYSHMHYGQGTYGFSCMKNKNHALGDMFELPVRTRISSIEVFAYAANSTTESPFTGTYIGIYDGRPDQGGKAVWGDTTTNRLIATDFTGCYRILFNTYDTKRPIMRVEAEVDLILEAGTYWLVYALESTYSVFFTPPNVYADPNTAGTAIQFDDGGWHPAKDENTVQASIPFRILGDKMGFVIMPRLRQLSKLKHQTV